MDKVFRVVIVIIPIAVILVGIGLWRNHYLKIKNAEPERVYKSPPLQTKKAPTKTETETPKVTSKKSDEKTDVTQTKPSITTQDIEESTTPEKVETPEEVDITSHPIIDTIFSDISLEDLPPKAIAALNQYKEAQTATEAVRKERKPLVSAKPIDWDAIGLLTDRLSQLRQQQREALEILAQYSEQASKKLLSMKAREIVSEQIVDEDSDLDSDALQRRYEELLEQVTEELEQVSD